MNFGQYENRTGAVGTAPIGTPLLFDPRGYLERNPDVKASGIDPFQHYLTFGAAEGRAASKMFDSAVYLAANPDVAAAGVNPLVHYFTFGMREGRAPAAVPTPDTFVFGADSGQDRVLDFQPRVDRISVGKFANGSTIDDAGDLLAAARQTSSDVVIDLGGGNAITLVGVTLTSLSVSNFTVT